MKALVGFLGTANGLADLQVVAKVWDAWIEGVELWILIWQACAWLTSLDQLGACARVVRSGHIEERVLNANFITWHQSFTSDWLVCQDEADEVQVVGISDGITSLPALDRVVFSAVRADWFFNVLLGLFSRVVVWIDWCANGLTNLQVVADLIDSWIDCCKEWNGLQAFTSLSGNDLTSLGANGNYSCHVDGIAANANWSADL